MMQPTTPDDGDPRPDRGPSTQPDPATASQRMTELDPDTVTDDDDDVAAAQRALEVANDTSPLP